MNQLGVLVFAKLAKLNFDNDFLDHQSLKIREAIRKIVLTIVNNNLHSNVYKIRLLYRVIFAMKISDTLLCFDVDALRFITPPRSRFS